MEISQYQQSVDDWIRTYGVRYFSELTNLGVLTEEVGELARLITRTYGDQSFKNTEARQDINEAIGDELADICFVVACLANQMEIDLEGAIQRNIDKKTQRDSQRHRDNPKL